MDNIIKTRHIGRRHIIQSTYGKEKKHIFPSQQTMIWSTDSYEQNDKTAFKVQEDMSDARTRQPSVKS